jgi:hypothetical protein
MMWRAPSDDEDGRECWWIVLPDTHPEIGIPGNPSEITWRTTERAFSEPHQMWDVSGTPPRITVSPSIDVMRFVVRNGQSLREGSYWHGHIRDGQFV